MALRHGAIQSLELPCICRKTPDVDRITTGAHTKVMPEVMQLPAISVRRNYVVRQTTPCPETNLCHTMSLHFLRSSVEEIKQCASNSDIWNASHSPLVIGDFWCFIEDNIHKIYVFPQTARSRHVVSVQSPTSKPRSQEATN